MKFYYKKNEYSLVPEEVRYILFERLYEYGTRKHGGSNSEIFTPISQILIKNICFELEVIK